MGPRLNPAAPHILFWSIETVRIKVQFNVLNSLISGRDSSVGIATRYGLDGPGIEWRWGGRDFPHPSRPALGPTQPSPGCKAAGAWR